MKRLHVVVLSSLLLLSSPAYALSSFHSDPVTDVPATVASTHGAKYGTTKTAWRKNTWANDKGKQVTVFVAWLFKDKLAHRVAYTPDGKDYLTIVYLGGTAALPKNIADKLTAANPGYAITAAQRYEAAGNVAFRVELRQGTTKIVKWTDTSGADVGSSKLPEGAEEMSK